ncbi:MAG: hypothetical protein GYA33_12900 [Thermogutta sp.]|nr:hypothetical protein [Thermogutta sp.]
MSATTNQVRSPLALLRSQPTLRLYDSIVQALIVHALRVRHYSRRTGEPYLPSIGRFLLFHDRWQPRQLAQDDLNGFMTHSAPKQHPAASTRNHVVSAIPFLYKDVLEGRLDRIKGVPRARRPDRFAIVLIVDKVSPVVGHPIGESVIRWSL